MKLLREKPYFMTNEKWYRVDRNNRIVLTAAGRRNQKVVESYQKYQLELQLLEEGIGRYK